MTKQFLMGNHVLAQASKEAGAKIMFGYPITPSTEIMEKWALFCSENKQLQFLQAEDEMAAGFGLIGACLAGVPAFTATAGPGNVLMQDAFSMAEALRVPTVAMIMQRGGLSTSTVIYSQEEVRLTCYGGNGEGFRIVYSTAGLQELYDYTFKAFQTAWRYRWPTFLLADGYQGKMMGAVNLKGGPVVKTEPLLTLKDNLRNCYNQEEEIGAIIKNYHQEYQKVRAQIEESESDQTQGAKVVLLAHGIVAAAAKVAVTKLRAKKKPVGLFRPITLRPFPYQACLEAIKSAQKIVVLESAEGQLASLFKDEVLIPFPLIEYYKPAMGFTPEEIENEIAKIS
ncbi:MAG: ferredoxin oxidoreductase [Candidatus Marinimicrobia bacterium]|nr:ferredoxin oxidoreductase [Candidatus Neomarinimicrobiota bacterium]